MKRVAVLVGMVAAAPSVAWGQVPTTATPAPEAAPALDATPAAAPTPPAPAEPGQVNAPPGGAAPPGDEYYTEPPTTAASPGPGTPEPFEPPVPGSAPFEPPPPPEAQHLAPRMSLWLGARVGWFFPFGNVWADAVSEPGQNSYYVLQGKSWRDYATSGPLLEIDAGVRISRNYTVFALWERAQLGTGDDESERSRGGEQDGAESDFWAIGLRASSDPDHIGFVTEVAVGYRRARTFFSNDVEYQFTDAPFEARLGLGAEFRLSRMVTLSPLVTIGVGGFGSAEAVEKNGNLRRLTGPLDEADGHAWATLQFGGHFDLLPSAK